MNKTIPHIKNSFQRYLFVFATIVVVLFSSCIVKASVKSLVGIPTKTEQGAPKSHNHISVQSGERCTVNAISDTQIVQKTSFNANDLLPALILTAVFLFTFGYRAVNKENKHPLYSGSGKIRSSIPLFLEYRKLIIHFAH